MTMQKILAVAALVLTAAAHADTYVIDPSHANVRFGIDHFNTSTNTGGFYNLTGTLQYRPQAQTGSVSVVIPTASINSGNAEFDKHLQSADIFNVARYPEMRFESTRFHFAEGKLASVEGRLTLLGQTHPLTLKAERFNCYTSPMLMTQVCGGDFSATLDRSRWGMNYLRGIVSNEVTLTIQIEAARQQSETIGERSSKR